jgi:hypothetical protein
MPNRELRIDNKIQDVSKLGSSFNVSAGKSGTSKNPVDVDLVTKLADDQKEVRGFGQPIAADLARDIAIEFIKKSDTAWKLLKQINDGTITDLDKIKASAGFANLLSLLDPNHQIVSGVFGKETILQMISLKDCEGIRYLIGEMEDKMTVVLTGVRDVSKKGDAKATSEPLAGWEHYQAGAKSDSPIPPDTEVHQSSLTRAELLAKLDRKELSDNGDEIVKVLFGEY